MADHRYVRTDHDIQTAFLRLVDRMPCEQITVAALVKETLITRTTFYSHYQDLPTLATKMIAQLLAEFADVLNTRLTLAVDNQDLQQVMAELLPEVQHVVMRQREKTRLLRKVTIGQQTIDAGLQQIIQQIIGATLNDSVGTYERAILNAILTTGLDHFLMSGELPEMADIRISLDKIGRLLVPFEEKADND